MPSGTIKRLVRDRGFGFIRDDGGQEWFFHRSSVQGSFDQLNEGQRVSFEEEPSAKGPRAGNVRGEAPQSPQERDENFGLLRPRSRVLFHAWDRQPHLSGASRRSDEDDLAVLVALADARERGGGIFEREGRVDGRVELTGVRAPS